MLKTLLIWFGRIIFRSQKDDSIIDADLNISTKKYINNKTLDKDQFIKLNPNDQEAYLISYINYKNMIPKRSSKGRFGGYDCYYCAKDAVFEKVPEECNHNDENYII